MGVILRVHPIRGESHIQHNANGEVATVSTDAYKRYRGLRFFIINQNSHLFAFSELCSRF